MIRSRLVPFLGATALATASLAQTFTVSPIAFAAREGNSTLSYIFTTAPNNTQQVHGDLRGPARLVTALSFRRDGVSTATTGLSRTIDMEIDVGEADFAHVGITYANNYVSPPVNVFTRKLVSTTDWTMVPPVPPAPFDFTLTFDVPFFYTGFTDFAWQMKCYSNSGASNDTVRVDLGSPAFTNSPSPGFGTACTSTGATQSYQLLGTMGTNINPEFRWSVQGFPTPANCALNVLLVGSSNPNLTVPGLCTTLNCSAEITLPMPASDANGTWTLPLFYIPFQNSLVGASFFEQAFSFDPGQSGLPLVGTVARQLTFQPPPASGDAAMIKSVRNFTAGATGAADGQSISEGGFVTQLTH
ncbi:MAG: hypothetical protein R3F56_10345 [Planctomycetota bacterium]